MTYPKKFEFPIHGNCVNFRNGFCTLIGVAVDPDGAVCSNFTPRSMIATPRTAREYPRARQSYQPHPPQTEYSLPPPYVYPPWIAYRQSYPTLQYRYGYCYHPHYSFNPVPSTLTAPRQGGAAFFSMSSGRRGRGGGRGSGGRGRMGGFAAGPGGSCVCPSCGYSTPHSIGTPCYQQTCPRCGGKMTRGS